MNKEIIQGILFAVVAIIALINIRKVMILQSRLDFYRDGSAEKADEFIKGLLEDIVSKPSQEKARQVSEADCTYVLSKLLSYQSSNMYTNTYLAKEIGLSPQGLSKIIRDNRMSMTTYRKINNYLTNQ